MTELYSIAKGDKKNPPVICIHGLLGSARNLYRVIEAIADAGFYVLAYDQRGHGHSPHSDDYSLEALAGDVFTFMDGHGISRAQLVGHSLGARVSLAAAGSQPARVQSLTMLDSGITISSKHLKNLHEIIDRLPASFANRAAAESALANHTTVMRQFLLANLRAQAEAPYILHWVFDLAGIRDELLNTIQTNQTETWKAIQCPTLIARGELSDSVSAGELTTMLALNPHARGAVIANAGHWVHVDNFQGTVELVTQFLKSVKK